MKLLLGHSTNSLIHGLDPRVKLVWMACNLLLIVICQKIWLLSLNLVLILVMTVWSGISLKKFSPLLKIMLVIGLQFIILQGFLGQQGTVICRIAFFKIYWGGILMGMKGILVLLTLMLLCLQFVMWTSPEDLTLLLVKLHLPHKYAALVGLALRFLPILEKDLEAIYESQQSRGLELTTTWQKAKGLLPVALPLILRALKRAQEAALSMELKGYTLYPERTFLKTLRFSKIDCLICSALCAYFSGVVIAPKLI